MSRPFDNTNQFKEDWPHWIGAMWEGDRYGLWYGCEWVGLWVELWVASVAVGWFVEM